MKMFEHQGKRYHLGYVITDSGSVFVQIPHDGPYEFAIADDDQTWPGGFGLGSEWEAIADDDPRITDEDRERLAWILEEARP